MSKAIRVEVFLIPFNDNQDCETETILETMANNLDDVIVKFGVIQEADIGEFTDDHEMNQTDCPVSKMRAYFKDALHWLYNGRKV